MSDFADHIESGNRANTAPKGGGKVRLLTLDDLDRRTRAYQAVEEVRALIVADLGGAPNLTTLESIEVENVALTAAMLKDYGVRWLRGEGIDVTLFATLMNTFNRSASLVGWQRRARDVTPDLRTYLAARAAPNATSTTGAER